MVVPQKKRQWIWMEMACLEIVVVFEVVKVVDWFGSAHVSADGSWRRSGGLC